MLDSCLGVSAGILARNDNLHGKSKSDLHLRPSFDAATAFQQQHWKLRLMYAAIRERGISLNSKSEGGNWQSICRPD
jgi:hypothetical protein